MFKSFDATFLGSTVLVVAALGLAWAAITGTELPVLGSGAALLIAVGIVGLAACAVGGVGQVTSFDLTDPKMLIGTVLGIAALAIVVAGLVGWAAPFQPLVQLVPGQAANASAVQLSALALAIVIAAKWLIGLGFGVVAR